MTRKPDDVVGSRGEPAAGGGHQTPEQAAITRQGSGGRDEAERTREWSSAGTPGRPPVSVGGSSGGHSDQVAAQGPAEGKKVADGAYRTERTGGKVDW
ncbi:hypothetical protein [Methylobacterium nonmethylotrophicum]|uniref:Uncharacterized protein n=1 Tax=Methylobacterium nonmethylotrophicum TaxID=1141884 RepID=A0A4Z0NPZ9_9HYPH|nr:hypothetical protein [Methylobacterium nonmethylotrophicum]TGD99013.1 hypothetical protein EU555_14000 [Methylobacterium nonmethylotrophicum]